MTRRVNSNLEKVRRRNFSKYDELLGVNLWDPAKFFIILWWGTYECVRIGGDSNGYCYTKKFLRILQRIIINNNIDPKQLRNESRTYKLWYWSSWARPILPFKVIHFGSVNSKSNC